MQLSLSYRVQWSVQVAYAGDKCDVIPAASLVCIMSRTPAALSRGSRGLTLTPTRTPPSILQLQPHRCQRCYHESIQLSNFCNIMSIGVTMDHGRVTVNRVSSHCSRRKAHVGPRKSGLGTLIEKRIWEESVSPAESAGCRIECLKESGRQNRKARPSPNQK
jgi:hypothetical protein